MQPTSTSCYTSNPFSLFSTVQYLFSVFSSNGLFSPPLSVGSRQARSGRGRRERKGINNWHERPLTSFLPLSLPPPSGGSFVIAARSGAVPTARVVSPTKEEGRPSFSRQGEENGTLWEKPSTHRNVHEEPVNFKIKCPESQELFPLDSLCLAKKRNLVESGGPKRRLGEQHLLPTLYAFGTQTGEKVAYTAKSSQGLALVRQTAIGRWRCRERKFLTNLLVYAPNVPARSKPPKKLSL